MSRLTITKSNRTDVTEDKKKPDENIIWPEWNDAEVTAEKWDIIPLKATKPGKDTKSISDIQESTTYEDIYVTPLPASILSNCNTWINLSSIYPDVKFVIFADTGYPDLVSLNRHLLPSEFYRSFISSIYNLLYLGITHPFAVEWPTGTFNPNTSSQPWKPWHHIYSLCKAGEGQHNPQVNTSGKYVVRLFWMGCWRKVIVDTFVPIDTSINILLPITKNKDKQVMELWPIILSKALLKLARLTWTSTEELVEYDIIQCLTGWVLQKIDTADLKMKEKWDIITGYTDHYVWTDTPPGEKKGKKNKEDKKKDPQKKSKKQIPTSFSSFHLVAVCNDLMDVTEVIPDISPCPSHGFLIDITRDIPLLQYPDPSTILPRWKEFRWIDWAVEKGIAEPVEKPHNIKYCKLISNFRRITDLDKDPSQESNLIKLNVEKVEEKKGKKDKKGKDTGKNKDTKEKTKSSKGSTKGGKKSAEEMPDPSFWTHFYNISDHIKYLKVYLLPSQMESCTVISDLEIDKKTVGKTPKKETNINRIYWLNGLKISHNEPIYLFMDSIDHKYIVFNLSHVGSKMSKPNNQYDIKDLIKSVCEKEVCINDLCINDCKCMEKEEYVPEIIQYNNTRTTGSVIIEEYNWKENKLGQMPYYLNTYGSKSFTLFIKPGRFVWRLWLHSCTNLVLNILSQTKIIIGPIEEIINYMKFESELITSKSYEICTAFGNVVKYFGTAEFQEHLLNYYKVYIPNGNFTKKELSTMHDCFMKTFLKKIDQQSTQKDKIPFLNALRSLFIDPSLNFPSQTTIYISDPIEEEMKTEGCPCEDITAIEKIRQRAAVKIQSFFKMIYVRKLKSKHNPENPHYLNIFENLKNIYNLIYSPSQRLNNLSIMIRNYVFHKKMIELKKHVPYNNDLSNIIKIDKIDGVLNNHEEKSWVFLTRFNFYVEHTILIKFCISSELPEYVLRIFDNDMNEEIKRYTNIPIITHYKKNESGYTVLAYGWTRDVPIKQNMWSITLIRQQTYHPNDVVIEKNDIQTQVIRDEYIPNLSNRIFRYIITSDFPECVSFRLSVSSKNVKVTLNCLTDSNVIINTITGVSNIILPYVSLQICTNKDSNISTVDQASALIRVSASKIKTSKKIRKSFSPKSTRKSKISDSYQLSSNATENYETRSVDTNTTEKSYDSNKFHNYYILEAYVEEESWPLTQPEWDRVEERRQKDYLEKELENSKNLKTKSKSINSMTNISTPYYEIMIVKNTNSTVNIELDRKKIEYIKNFKMKCFNYDIENLRKAKEIRQTFVDSFKPKSISNEIEGNAEVELPYEFTYNYGDSNERLMNNICSECNKQVPIEEPKFLFNPNSEIRYLPEFKLNKVYEFDYYRRVLTEDVVKNYSQLLIERNVIFGEKYHVTKIQIDKHNEALQEKIDKLKAHYEEKESESKETYEELDLKRSAVITRLLQEEAALNTKPKDQKKGKKK